MKALKILNNGAKGLLGTQKLQPQPLQLNALFLLFVFILLTIFLCTILNSQTWSVYIVLIKCIWLIIMSLVFLQYKVMDIVLIKQLIKIRHA
jgi:hypothetical protein